VKQFIGLGYDGTVKICCINNYSALFINVVDLMSYGTSGIPETTRDPLVHCWVPILVSGKNAVIVPVYLIDPATAPTLRKPDNITVVYQGKK
jgi:hypothetical protein